MALKTPTKGNLMDAKRERELASTGWDLMDRKRNILIRELMSRIEEVRDLQALMEKQFSEAYQALKIAEFYTPDCYSVAEKIPLDDSLQLRFKSVMGVEVPTVITDKGNAGILPYDLSESSAAMDEAYRKFTDLKEMLAKITENETAVYRLATAIKKAQKRANALENIVIPGLDEDIRRISDALEEHEREEFTRMKVIKKTKKS